MDICCYFVTLYGIHVCGGILPWWSWEGGEEYTLGEKPKVQLERIRVSCQRQTPNVASVGTSSVFELL
jgi:hypothetical protein